MCGTPIGERPGSWWDVGSNPIHTRIFSWSRAGIGIQERLKLACSKEIEGSNPFARTGTSNKKLGDNNG